MIPRDIRRPGTEVQTGMRVGGRAPVGRRQQRIHRHPARRQHQVNQILLRRQTTEQTTRPLIELKFQIGVRTGTTLSTLASTCPYFLRRHELLVDPVNNRLIDTETGRGVTGRTTQTATRINAVYTVAPYSDLLKRFPNVTANESVNRTSQTHTTHHIITNGQPVAARARRLSGEKYNAAKKEIEQLLNDGVITRSNSNWSSPLHLVRKSNGEWRPCGDYRHLNKQTRPDRYPLPHLHDSTHNLNGRTIFSTIDLAKAYNQIPIEPAEDQRPLSSHLSVCSSGSV